jgi:ATP-dependent Clp protease ATP-binding subunit ClpC
MFERFTDGARRVIDRAQESARNSNTYIGTEHILLGVAFGEGIAARALERRGVTLEMIDREVRRDIARGVAAPTGRIPLAPSSERAMEHARREALGLGHNHIGPEHLLLGLIREDEGAGARILVKLGASLDGLRYTVVKLMTDHVGRAKEIDRLVQVLSRRTRHNPVLVGERGVGKTAVFDGLAQRIAAGGVPERLRGKEVHALDHVGREGGERLREALTEVRARDDVILLLDDISDLLHGNHAEILSAAVLHGDVLIGCTATPESYRRANAESPALAQLFQPIQVTEMSAETAMEVLRVMRGRLTDHHHLVIEDEVLTAAVELASRYNRQHRLPRSAVDLIDEACVRTAGSANLDEAELSRTMQDLRNEWKIEAQLLGTLEPAYRGNPARPAPEAFLQVYGGVDTEIWRIG